MNKVVPLLLFYLLASVAQGQNRANVWMLGYQPFSKDPAIDFNSGVADTFSVAKNLEFFLTNASICDSNGELLFYTNGIYIADKNHDTLDNSGNFNPGYATEEHFDEGLSASQAVLILPMPEGNSEYVVFHFSAEHIENNTQTQPLELRYSIVDMSVNGGLGGVTIDKKTVSLVQDTLVWGRTTACKHANGRDWWVITHRWNSDLYYKFLLTPDSIYGPFEQQIGSKIIKDDQVGQACFSPDGSKFCYMNRNYNFDYMEFDRCSGEFTNPTNILLPDSNLSQGIAFSPNNRFIYCNTYTQLFQFDTWANDVEESRILIDTIPFYQSGTPDWFAVEMLAPDNKIYISTYNSIDAMHVINNPDSLGVSCDFVRQGLNLPQKNGYAIPNHPNYDLGPITGSECDTLYLSNSSLRNPDFSFSLVPNPSSGILNIVYNTTEDCLLTLFNINGKQVASVSLFHYFKNRLLNVSELPPGVYLAAVSCKGERVWSEKVVVQR